MQFTLKLISVDPLSDGTFRFRYEGGSEETFSRDDIANVANSIDQMTLARFVFCARWMAVDPSLTNDNLIENKICSVDMTRSEVVKILNG